MTRFQIRSHVQRGFWFALLVVAATGCVSTPEQDPVVQRMTEIDGRLLRIERILSNQALLEQAQRVEALNAEVRALRGQVEQLQHNIDSSRNQQRDLYADLDRRMQALEAKGVSAPAMASSGGGTAPAEDDASAYKKAFDLLKDGKYSEAGTAFTQFISTYPQSALLDNAHYWLGEARYVGKDFAAALRDFRTVVDRFPDSRKLQDAWLKIGYCQYELKNWKDARDALKRTTQLGGDTPTGKLAEQRLAKMQAEGR
ncbi:MAG TPA: tol-pal system protein YbgF [Steroidobacteraceae bacterium]|nr:tol-pal system protein YbgF [Steroidobacteraceae bacterium]